MNKIIVFVVTAECCITIGQICFKKSANQINIDKTPDKPWIIQLLDCVFRSPVLWLGLFSMVVGLLFWFAALDVGDLNFVYLLGSIQYIFALIAAHFFLQEKINSTKLIGTLLIMLGIILTAIS